MEKQIKDYLKYCIGGEIKHQSFVKPFILYSVSESGCRLRAPDESGPGFSALIENIKPIRRKLSSMTEDEAKHFFGLRANAEIYERKNNGTHTEFLYKWQDDEVAYSTKDGKGYSSVSITHNANLLETFANNFHYLLSKGFWLFGDEWFDEGIIIDKETVTNKS